MVLEVLNSRAQRAVRRGCLRMEPQHRPVFGSWSWLETLRSRRPNLDLFVYHHHERGVWVLADWVFRPGEDEFPVCTELEVLTRDPNLGWPFDMDIETLHARLAPAREHIEILRTHLNQVRGGHRAGLEAEQAEQRDLATSLRRRGEEEIARAVEQPGTLRSMQRDSGAVKEAREEAVDRLVWDSRRSS